MPNAYTPAGQMAPLGSEPGFAPKSLQGYAPTIPYYQVTCYDITDPEDPGTGYPFGAAQNATVNVRSNEQDVRALGTTTLWMVYDVPDVTATIAQNLGYGDPCPLLLGNNYAGVIATQTDLVNDDLPYFSLEIATGGLVSTMPQMRLDGIDVAAAVGAFATLDWRFSGYKIQMAQTGLSGSSWQQPSLTTQAAFVRQGNVYVSIAGVTHRVQNARMTCNLAREPLKQLGTHEPFASVPQFPVRTEATVECFPVGQGPAINYYSTGDMDPGPNARPTVFGDALLVFRTAEGFFGRAPSGYNKCTFKIPNANCTAVTQTGTVTAWAATTYTVQGFDLAYKAETV